MTILHIDLETRSACDLKAAGVHVYAADPSTEILCCAYAFDDEPVQLWVPTRERRPDAFASHVQCERLVYAHNASFELNVWNALRARYDLPYIFERQLRCTMAMALAMGLPAALDNAAAALGLDTRKDAKGARVMMQLSKPRKVADDGTITWWDDPEKFATLYEYCKQDVEVERALHKRLLELSHGEQFLWQLDQRINNRGVAVDRAAIERGIALVEGEKKRLDLRMRAVTGGAVATCTATGQLTGWLKWSGVDVSGVAKADVTEMLTGELPPACRNALLLRQEAAKSSTAKLKKMLAMTGEDGRMRGLFQYHGAATGRWAARGAQLQNLPRPAIVKDQDEAIAHFDNPAYLEIAYGSPMQVVSDCLRGMIVPKSGSEFTCADYSNIEGRVLAWLAGEGWKLDAFRAFDLGFGPDLYLVAASRIFRCKVEDAAEHRQIGKVSELACGYGGGVGAFQSMAKIYGVQVGDERAEQIKTAWREAHPETVMFWHKLESAALRAATSGGIHHAGPIAFTVKGSFLWCRLPSGRLLCYPYPQVKEKEMPWSTAEKPAFRPCLSYMAVNGITRKWERCDTYGGSLAENVTQAVARDLLADAIIKVEAAGFDVVMHVHDEIVVEAPLRTCTVDTLTTIMRDTPEWAAGLPVAAEGWSGARYRKA